MRQNDTDPSYPARMGAPVPARIPAATTAAARERRRAFKRLRLHRQFVPLLVLFTLLSTVGIAGIAYIGSRSAALSAAQSRAAQDAEVLRDEVTSRGAPLRLTDGRFVVGAGSNALTLNDDTSIVDHATAILSADTAIYELEGARLVAVSTTLPGATKRDLGDTLPATVSTVLIGSCGAGAHSACYQSFDGAATLAGRQYVVDAVPLFDATGAFVGAVSAALPLDAVLAPATQLSVVLLLVGALLALVSLASGTWIYGARVESVLERLDGRLNRLADAAGDLEHLARSQVERSSRQSSVAGQIAEQVRALDAMAHVMGQGHAALRDTTTEIWAEISQPGLAPDITLATRLAQQTAIASARVGSAAEDARDLCRQLVAQMNHITAEAGMVSHSGHALEQRARDLRACVEGVEVTLGERIRKRMPGSSLPLIRRVRAASQHLRWLVPAWAVPATDLRVRATAASGATLQSPPAAPSAQPEDIHRAGSLWDWQDEYEPASRSDRDPAQLQPRTPVDPSFGDWLSSTGHHITPPRISGTLRPSRLRAASSGSLPPAPRDSARKGDPAASLPRPPQSPRPLRDPASSDESWKANRARRPDWLDD